MAPRDQLLQIGRQGGRGVFLSLFSNFAREVSAQSNPQLSARALRIPRLRLGAVAIAAFLSGCGGSADDDSNRFVQVGAYIGSPQPPWVVIDDPGYIDVPGDLIGNPGYITIQASGQQPKPVQPDEDQTPDWYVGSAYFKREIERLGAHVVKMACYAPASTSPSEPYPEWWVVFTIPTSDLRSLQGWWMFQPIDISKFRPPVDCEQRGI